MPRPPFRQISPLPQNLIPSRSMLPCSTLRVSLETGGNGRGHPFAPWPEYKKRSRREYLRLRFYPFSSPFSMLWHHSAPYCRPNQRQRFTFEASGGRTKPDAPPTPRRAQPPERPSAPRRFGSTRRAAIPPTARSALSFPAPLQSSFSRPSTVTVTTCHGINFPLCWSAFFAASSSPPQHGTSIRTTVTLLMLFSRMISVSFSA
mgnify:FL=1